MTTPKKSSLNDIARRPWPWMVMTLASSLAFVFEMYTGRINKADATCEERIGKYSAAIVRKDSIILFWQTQYIGSKNDNIGLMKDLLIKNRIIDRTDSVVHSKLQTTVTQILKDHDR